MEGIDYMEFDVVVPLVVNIIEKALPMGLVFVLADRIVNFFLKLAFPKD